MCWSASVSLKTDAARVPQRQEKWQWCIFLSKCVFACVCPLLVQAAVNRAVASVVPRVLSLSFWHHVTLQWGQEKRHWQWRGRWGLLSLKDTIITTGKVGDVRQVVSNDALWIQVSAFSWISPRKRGNGDSDGVGRIPVSPWVTAAKIFQAVGVTK